MNRGPGSRSRSEEYVARREVWGGLAGDLVAAPAADGKKAEIDWDGILVGVVNGFGLPG